MYTFLRAETSRVPIQSQYPQQSTVYMLKYLATNQSIIINKYCWYCKIGLFGGEENICTDTVHIFLKAKINLKYFDVTEFTVGQVNNRILT